MIFWRVSLPTISVGSMLTSVSQAQNDNLQVHEEKTKGVYVKNLSDYYVSSAREVYEIMRTGGAARVVTSTSQWFNFFSVPLHIKSLQTWMPNPLVLTPFS